MDLDLALKAKKIKLVAFDVDGVMTDGSLTWDENGVEYKTFNAKDGQGVVMLNNAGFKTAIITARDNKTVNVRAEILHITKLHYGSKDKKESLLSLLDEFKVNIEEVAYMGDDLPDLCVLREVGLSACPNDAVNEVKSVCDFISSKNGGRGAVRELCDLILKANSINPEDVFKK